MIHDGRKIAEIHAKALELLAGAEDWDDGDLLVWLEKQPPLIVMAIAMGDELVFSVQWIEDIGILQIDAATPGEWVNRLLAMKAEIGFGPV